MTQDALESATKAVGADAEIERLRAELAKTKERLERTEKAFGSFVPRQFLQFLSVENVRHVRLGMQAEHKMTILFSDIRNFTGLSETMTPQENFDFLNSYLSQMEPVILPFHGFVDKYIGDAIMALFPERADDAVQGALAMLDRLDQYNRGRARAGFMPLRIGIGINTGIVMLGVVGGSGRMDGTVISDAVNLAARLEELSKVYGVPLLVSEHVVHSLEDPERYCIRFLDRSRVKGKKEAQSVYEVFDADPPKLREAKKRTRYRFEEALAFFFTGDLSKARTRLARCLDEAPDDLPAQLYLKRCDELLRTGSSSGFDEADFSQTWGEEYSSGLPDLDSHHRKLLSQINALASAVRERRTGDTPPILAYLEKGARQHFDGEEALMQESRYPFAADHASQHQRFRSNLSRLGEDIRSEAMNPVYLAFRIKLLLMDWMINHSMKSDRHLAHHLKSRNRG